ncbi:Uncharacterized protein HZ326_6744 [Fusarium oxysporum f. sp. albedinis]|nr:Uncharacterized protein HZ326_6744 [Fusarium oxysporum f. sp. albedinis]
MPIGEDCTLSSLVETTTVSRVGFRAPGPVGSPPKVPDMLCSCGSGLTPTREGSLVGWHRKNSRRLLLHSIDMLPSRLHFQLDK